MCKDTYKIIKIIIFLLFILNINLLCDVDSSKIDSSSYSIIPIKSHGLISLNDFNRKLINKRNISWEQYTNISDIIENRFPVYNLNLGQFGEIGYLSLFSADNNENSILFNGHNLSNNYLPNSFNINNYSTEFFENIECYIGSDAVIFGNNSSSILLNMQEIIYNTREPYTKIFYSQAANEYISGDFIFSKNISTKLNLFLGVKSQTAENQLINNEFEYWNVRSGLRWNLDSISSISFVYNFINHNIERNGGNNFSFSNNMFDNITSIPKFTQLSKNEFLHNVNITGTKEISNNKKIFSNILFSLSLNKEDYDSTIAGSINRYSLNNNYNHWHSGALIGVSSINNILSYDAGAEIKYSNYGDSFIFNKINILTSSAYARGVLSIDDNISFSFGSRFTYYNKKLYKNLGTSINFHKLLNSRIDFSYSEHLPAYNYKPDFKKSNILAFYSLDKKLKKMSISANIFYRIINNSMDFTSVRDSISEIFQISYNNKHLYGASVSILYEIIDNLFINIWNIYQVSQKNDMKIDYFPKFYSGFDINYSREVGRSKFKIGINGSFRSKHNSLGFSPLPNIDDFNITEIENKNFYDGVNIYLILRLGQAAYVKLSGENLLNSQYYIINLYPMPSRSLKISLLWEFFD